MKEKLGGMMGPLSKFHIEAERAPSGMLFRIGGIIGIADYSSERVSLKSHGGRIILSGRRLSVSIYEDRTVEIVGRVEEVGFSYGKN